MGALLFDGVDDKVKSTSLGVALAALSGSVAATLLWLIKAPAVDDTFDGLGYLLSGTGNGTVQFGASIDAGEDINMDLGDARVVAGTFATNVYMLIISKPTGASVTCRLHWKQASGGAWTHTNFSGTHTFATVATMLELGAWQAGDFFGSGHMGVFGAWGVDFTDAQAEACDDNWRTSDLYNHAAGTPVSLIELNTTTPTDIGSAPAASLTVTGATVSAETLDSWNFDGTGGGGATAVSGAGAISSAEAFGTTKALRVARPVPGISSAEAFGTTRLLRLLRNAGAVGSAESFGTPNLLRQLRNAGGVGSAEALGEPAFRFVVRPAGIGTAEAFGILHLGLRGVGAIGSGEAFGTPAVRFVVSPVGVGSGEAFGEPRFVTIVLQSAGAIGSAEAFGEPRVVRMLHPVGLESGEQFGAASVRRDVRQAGGITSAEDFGLAKFITNVIRGAGGIQSAESFGGTALARILTAAGVGSAEAFGQPKVLRIVRAVSLTTGEAFGTATLAEFDPTEDKAARGRVWLSDRSFATVLVSDGDTYLVTVSDVSLADVTVADIPGG